MIWIWSHKSTQIFISISSFKMKSICDIELLINMPITKTILEITIDEILRWRCGRWGWWISIQQFTIEGEHNIINSNVDILPICNIIGSCPFYVVGGHCLGGESQFSILSHDEMSWKMFSIFSQNPHLITIGNKKRTISKSNSTDGNQGSWLLMLFSWDWEPSMATWLWQRKWKIIELYNYWLFIYLSLDC